MILGVRPVRSPDTPRRRGIRPLLSLVAVGALTIALGGAVLAAAPRSTGAGSPTGVSTADQGPVTAGVGAGDHPLPIGDTGSDGGRYGPVTIGKTHYAIPPGAYFVAPTGSDRGPGSQSAPWHTVTHAVAVAPAGATIVIRGGIYHESVVAYKRVTLQSYPGEAVWFDGSRPVTGWVRDGSAWRRDGWTTRFDHTDPTAKWGTYWHMVDPAYPMANWPDEVFVNGRQLRQVASRTQVTTGTFFTDYAHSRLYIGSDPAKVRIDATTLGEALYLNGANASIVRGIGFRRYATPMLRAAAVKGFANDLLFENDAFNDTAYIGLSVKGANIVVRHNAVFRNGELGINPYRAPNALITGNLVEGNNDEHFEIAPQSGGIKAAQSADVRVTGNEVDYNYGMGIWLDDQDHHSVIARNITSHNDGNGVQFEISNGCLIAGNQVVANARSGIRMLDSSNGRLWNNTVVGNYGNQIEISAGSRSYNEKWVNWRPSGEQIFNNLMQSGPAGTNPLLAVQDVTGGHGAGQMVTADHNAYYRPGGSPAKLVLWVDLTTHSTGLANLTDFRAVTGSERHGVGADTAAPVFPGAEYLLRPGSAPRLAGAPIPPDVAALMAAVPGSTPGIGALF